MLMPMTEGEVAKVQQLKSKAKKLAQPRSDELRATYTARKVAEMVAEGMCGMDASEAVQKALSDDIATLPSEWVVYLNNNTPVTVGKLCKSSSKYDGVSMRDPVDPNYGAGRAKFYWNDGKPTLHSLAHGESKTYICKLPADLIFSDELQAVQQVEPEKESDPLSWAKIFEVSDEDMAKIADPKWVIKNLIIQGHFIVIPAPPNGGKTTIMLHLSGQMVSDEYKVFYVNADVSGADAKGMQKQAKEHGFSLMLPDFQAGLSMSNVVDHLKIMAGKETDYSNVVFVFDTLKKMTDVINKSQAKGLYKILRSLTAKGMTVICLSHTNKYKGEDGHDVFEGTGDLRADADEMIFLVPRKNNDGSMTVSTRPDKVRGSFEPITFNISAGRQVSQAGKFIDVEAQRAIDDRRAKDELVIELITDVLSCNKKFSQSEVVKAVRLKGSEVGEKKIRDVLHRWSGQLWSVEDCRDKNRKEYSSLVAALFDEVSFL